MNNSYVNRRKYMYDKLKQEGIFTWDTMYGEEYALASIHFIDHALRTEIQHATERLGRIFHRVLQVVSQADQELLLDLGIPSSALDAVRLGILGNSLTTIGRFDFAPTPRGIKMLEFNSDTPTGIVEAYHVNKVWCDYYGVENPNHGMNEHIILAFTEIISYYKKHGFRADCVHFSSLDWHDEDAGTTRYLLQESGIKGQFVPLDRLRLFQDELHVQMNEDLIPVEILYRLHALEKLAEECDPISGYPIGAHVLDLVARNKLAIINPPSAFLSQTKALQALIWNLHEENQFFTQEEHHTVARYMLPTYIDNVFVGRSNYVTKPYFGREGGAVSLFDKHAVLIAQDQEQSYWDQPMVYQEMVDLQRVTAETLQGEYEGHLLWGSFYVGGRPSAIIARLGGRITGNLAYYLPIGLK